MDLVCLILRRLASAILWGSNSHRECERASRKNRGGVKDPF